MDSALSPSRPGKRTRHVPGKQEWSLPTPTIIGVLAGGVLGRWREMEDEDGPQGSLLLYPFLVFLYFCVYECCILTTVD